MPTLAEALVQIRAIKTYISVMFAILIWDSLATLPAEYRYVWKVRFQLASCTHPPACSGWLMDERTGSLDATQVLVPHQVSPITLLITYGTSY